MGSISSKNDDSLSSICSSDSLKLRRLKSRREHSFEPLERIKEEREDENTGDCIRKIVVEVSNTDSDNRSLKQFGISARFRRSSEGELVAAGWPAWLSAAAGEAIDGWLPLKSENFEKLEKVEQLHKIFKLCGSQSDEYWTKSRLPLAAMFRSQCVYESSLRERCKELPRTAVDLISTLLSIEPEKRVTARSALQAKYFYTKPYPCDPASMPTYPPNKEINAKFREAARRKKGGGRVRASGGSRGPKRVHSCKLIPKDRNPYFLRPRDSVNSKASYDTVSDVPQAMASNGSFMWETKRQEHLQRLQSLMQPDFLNSTQVYKPHVLSYDHQDQKQSGHTTMLNRFHSGDIRRLEYYALASVHRSHSSRDVDM